MQELFTFLVVFVVAKTNGDPGDFRPPAIPLIVFSPHVSGKCRMYFTEHRNEDKTLLSNKKIHRNRNVKTNLFL
jgi:hypothetical protein